MSAKGKSGGGKLAKRAAKRAASHRSAVLVDRALYGGGGALAVLTAIMVAYFMASETSGAGVKALSSSGDPEGVKDALFGGDPWVCAPTPPFVLQILTMTPRACTQGQRVSSWKSVLQKYLEKALSAILNLV